MMKLFEGPGFTLEVPSGWLVTAAPGVQAAFIGPRIGEARTGFVVTVEKLSDRSRFPEKISTLLGKQQESLPRYVVLGDEDLSQPDSYDAFQRSFCWYNEKIDMTIFQRQLFVLVDDRFYTLTASQPNNEQRDGLDILFVGMFNSFRVTPFELPEELV